MHQIFYRLTICFFSFIAFQAQAGYTTFQFDGLTRQYIYYAPANLPSNAPLLFVLHGFGGSGSGWNGYFNTLASQNKFAVCYPDGQLYANNGGVTVCQWNTRYEADYEQKGMKNDITFLDSLAKYLQQKYRLDPTKTFVTGHSNGADMCFMLASESQGVFKAAAPSAGTMMNTEITTYCTQPGIPLYCIHAVEDPVSWYDGDQTGTQNYGLYRGSWWCFNNVFKQKLGLDICDSINLPDINTTDNCTVTTFRYRSSFNKNESWYYRVNGSGGQHNYNEGSLDFSPSDSVWKFFQRYIDTRTGTASIGNSGQVEAKSDQQFAIGQFLNGKLDLTLPLAGRYKLAVCGIDGVVVAKIAGENVINGLCRVSLRIPPGVYLASLRGDGNFAVKKIQVFR